MLPPSVKFGITLDAPTIVTASVGMLALLGSIAADAPLGTGEAGEMGE